MNRALLDGWLSAEFPTKTADTRLIQLLFRNEHFTILLRQSLERVFNTKQKQKQNAFRNALSAF